MENNNLLDTVSAFKLCSLYHITNNNQGLQEKTITKPTYTKMLGRLC